MAFFVGNTEITFRKNGDWIDVDASSDAHLFRQKFRALKGTEFPLRRSGMLFPEYPDVICSLFWPWDHLCIVDWVRGVLEGKPPQTPALPAALKKMRVPFDPVVSLVDQVASLSIFNRPPPDREEVALKHIRCALQIGELAIFHFLSKKLSQETQTLLARELKGKKILSEVRRRESALLKTAKTGITNQDDKLRNDCDYVHGYIAFPLLSNRKRLKRISPDLSSTAMLQMAFVDRAHTVVLPYDVGDLRPHQFTFLGKRYTVSADSDKIDYIEGGKVLFSHALKDETFYGNSCAAIQGLSKVLARFVIHLDEQDRDTVLSSNGSLLKELFNDLFAFEFR